MCASNSTFLKATETSVSCPPATTNSSSAIYNNANVLKISTEDLTPPNARVPPPVGHPVCSLDVYHCQPSEDVGGMNPMAAPAADGDEVWYCCGCGQGPWLVAVYAACMSCNHGRCYYCKVE